MQLSQFVFINFRLGGIFLYKSDLKENTELKLLKTCGAKAFSFSPVDRIN